jgi:hypothetical protein
MRKIDSLTHAVSKGEKKCLDMIEQDQLEPDPEQGGGVETVGSDPE